MARSTPWKRALSIWGLWLYSALATFGCGSRGSVDWTAVCRARETACLSTQVGQICNEQGQWATFQCAANQECKSGACVAAGDPCSPGTGQCLGNQAAQICDEHGQWLSFACPAGQTCQNGACAVVAGSCSNGTSQCLNTRIGQICNQQQWLSFDCASGQVCRDGACVDTLDVCSPNAHECSSEGLQRICSSDGTVWLSAECPDGMTCRDGECAGSCEPGLRLCAAHAVVRECRADGSGYVEQECALDRMCDQGKCVPDPSLPCPGYTDGYGICQDQRTLLRCKSDGSGYESTTCSEGTRCEMGQCLGPVCAAGETSCTSLQISNLEGIRTCSDDGTEYLVSVCQAQETCVRNTKTGRYECYEPPCTRDETRCGDVNGSYSDSSHLSRCETLLDGRLGWVSYLCNAPSACKAEEGEAAVCHAECAPGDQRCSDDDSAIETCDADGKWTTQSCESEGATLVCLVVPTNQRVVCGDEDCADLQYGEYAYETRGRCSAAQIRKCNEDGKLEPAQPCEEGTCLPDGDGFGRCKDPSRCDQADGWRECTPDNDAVRTCQSSHWEFTPCPAEQVCLDDEWGRAACGRECVPKSRRCDGAKYQICSAEGEWGPSTACETGECDAITKRCEVACQPGEIRCSGEVVVATDTSSLGSASMQVCQADGRWGKSEACASGQACRRTANGVHLGCVECVGEVPGGNEEGSRDYRCTPDARGWQACQDNNTWPTQPTSCGASEKCVRLRDGSISGSCSDSGCSSGYSRRCLAYASLDTPRTITDCCAGDCNGDTAECLHRQSEYDPSCPETVSCFTGQYDGEVPIEENCCAGYCKYGERCLRVKAPPCAAVTRCEVKKIGVASVCCGSCNADGSCPSGEDAEHPLGEYFSCGNSLCWNIGSCTWSPTSRSGAMYATCKTEP